MPQDDQPVLPVGRNSTSARCWRTRHDFNVIGDKVDQAFGNHAEGTVVAIFTDLAGERRYAVEMFGHRTIKIAIEGSLVAPGL